MKRELFVSVMAAIISGAAVSCEILDNDPDRHAAEKKDSTYVGLEEVAQVLSLIPLQHSQLSEVHSAVTSSSCNGYDEEYTMNDLFRSPGAGVGDERSDVKSGSVYETPLKELIERQVRSLCETKVSDGWSWTDPEKFLNALTESDIQIYWPYSEEWDGSTMPIITFDPEDGSEVNVGYRFIDDDGFRRVEQVVVDEEMAMSEPVWVVNRNSDAGFTTLEMLRREDPDWGEGGGNIVVRPQDTKSEDQVKTLILRNFTMNRNYDPWFTGASEFFVKIGYMENFTASTEAELKLYSPLVTDFMIVVRRNQVGIPQNFNAIMMSDWSEKADACALMITESDGGTRTEWATKAKVFIAGKSYGVEISIPLNVRDDVVWRGSLAYGWIERYDGETWPFGDVDLTFEVVGMQE